MFIIHICITITYDLIYTKQKCKFNENNSVISIERFFLKGTFLVSFELEKKSDLKYVSQNVILAKLKCEFNNASLMHFMFCDLMSCFW